MLRLRVALLVPPVGDAATWPSLTKCRPGRQALAPEFLVEASHQGLCRLVVDLPQAGHHRTRPGDLEDALHVLSLRRSAGLGPTRSMFPLDLTQLTPEQRALVDLWETHLKAEFQDKDAASSCDTMVECPSVNHVPVLTGGVGRRQLEALLRQVFHPEHAPRRRTRAPLADSRPEPHRGRVRLPLHSHDPDGLVLPGVPPMGRLLELVTVVIATFEGGKIHHEHIHWDQASALVQSRAAGPDDVSGGRGRGGSQTPRPRHRAVEPVDEADHRRRVAVTRGDLRSPPRRLAARIRRGHGSSLPPNHRAPLDRARGPFLRPFEDRDASARGRSAGLCLLELLVGSLTPDPPAGAGMRYPCGTSPFRRGRRRRRSRPRECSPAGGWHAHVFVERHQVSPLDATEVLPPR